MDIQEDYSKYLRHQKGLALLWLWMEQWSGLQGWSWSTPDSLLTLSQLSSQRFVFGAPLRRSVRAQHVFLGAQADEAGWMKRIAWKRLVLDAPTSRLWMVSPHYPSPDTKWPDLPGFALGIAVNVDRLGAWKGSRMDLRGIWWDGEGRFHVDLSAFRSLNVRHAPLAEGFPESERQSIKSMRDIVMDRINSTNTLYNPGFEGESPALSSEQYGLIRPFEEPSKKGKPIEMEYPEMFGQFLNEDDPRNKIQK